MLALFLFIGYCIYAIIESSINEYKYNKYKKSMEIGGKYDKS